MEIAADNIIQRSFGKEYDIFAQMHSLHYQRVNSDRGQALNRHIHIRQALVSGQMT